MSNAFEPSIARIDDRITAPVDVVVHEFCKRYMEGRTPTIAQRRMIVGFLTMESDSPLAATRSGGRTEVYRAIVRYMQERESE